MMHPIYEVLLEQDRLAIKRMEAARDLMKEGFKCGLPETEAIKERSQKLIDRAFALHQVAYAKAGLVFKKELDTRLVN